MYTRLTWHLPLILAALLVPAASSEEIATKRFRPDEFIHPGGLHTHNDIERVKMHVSNQDEPWYTSFKHLEQSDHAQSIWEPSPHEVLVRGDNGEDEQNYQDAYRDAHSAYQLALRWLITDDTTYADTAVEILDAWSFTLTDIDGNYDRFLAAGLYGYQFANAGELLRSYPKWPIERQAVFGAMLNDIFAVYSRLFLDEHDGIPNHYYANWDLCNIASLMAIGIFNDNHTMYDFAVNYFINGPADGVVANGALPFFVIANFTEDVSGKVLSQGQEAGRDQGHALLAMMLAGVVGQHGYNQGVDLFATFENQILNLVEYAAKYNVNETVPYEPYNSTDGYLDVIAPDKRSERRPGYELLASHYSDVKGLNAAWSRAYRDHVNSVGVESGYGLIEGGGGDFGPLSGGYDAFGHGTLMYRVTGE